MGDQGLQPGTYVYPVSRHKCMAIGIMSRDQGPGKTTCCQPKGHKGPHRNVRGEEWANNADLTAIAQADQDRMAAMEKQIEELKAALAEKI